MKNQRFLRGPFVWIAVLLVALFMTVNLISSASAPEELTFNQFVELARDGAFQADTGEDTPALEQAETFGLQSRTITGQYLPQGERDPVEFEVTYSPEINRETLSQLIDDGLITMRGDNEQSGALVNLLFTLLPFALIFLLFFFLMQQMQGGGGRVMQFGKSKAKLVSKDSPKVTFADVAGAEEAKEELREIKDFLENPAKFQAMGAKIPKGALLFGPPGTGKTLLARAVAGEAGVPFFSISGSDFVEMFVGVGASRVRDLFEQAKANAPSIIFMDEIDAVGRHRGAGLGGGHDEREQTLNQLLVEMDGFESNEGVILIAATNRPDVLDPALLRPGRFDRQIVVDAPDVKGREGILRVHLKKVPLAEDVKVEALAKGTPGMSGADLANLVNEAALLAARRGRDRVMMEDLESAKDKIMLGAERKSLVLSEAERKLTAYHEAGHAVVALRVPGLDPIHKVTIVPRGRALGVTSSLPEEDRHSYSRDYLVAQLAMLFGGRAAEEMTFGADKITTGAGNDIERATNLARRMVATYGMSEKVGPMAVGDSEQEVFLGRELVQRREVSEETARLVDDEVKAFLDDAYRKATAALRDNHDLLERIAEALLERETLDRAEIGLLEKGEPLPPDTNGSEPVQGAPIPPSDPELEGAGADAGRGAEVGGTAARRGAVPAGRETRRVRAEEPEADAS